MSQRYNPIDSPKSSDSSSAKDTVLPFVRKTFGILSEHDFSSIISWSSNGDSFVVWDTTEFAAQVLPRHFKHTNFCSFVRQLNTYGFNKVDSKLWEFRHDSFRRGHPELLSLIQRRRSNARRSAVKVEGGVDVATELAKLRATMSAELTKLAQAQHVTQMENQRLALELRQHRASLAQVQGRMQRFTGVCSQLLGATIDNQVSFADDETRQSVLRDIAAVLDESTAPSMHDSFAAASSTSSPSAVPMVDAAQPFNWTLPTNLDDAGVVADSESDAASVTSPLPSPVPASPNSFEDDVSAFSYSLEEMVGDVSMILNAQESDKPGHPEAAFKPSASSSSSIQALNDLLMC